MLLALLPSTLFKIDKSATFSVLSTGTLRLLPISILGASAGTIRAVPDTVKKVSGLAPVLFNFQVIILLQKEIVFEYEYENSIGDIGSSDNEGVISEYVSNLEQSELTPNRNITVTIFEKMKGFEYELNTNIGTVGCSSHRDLASNYKLDPNRLESAPALPISVTFIFTIERVIL